MIEKRPVGWPGVAFINLVLRTSTGDPQHTATNPALKAQKIWVEVASAFIPIFCTAICLN